MKKPFYGEVLKREVLHRMSAEGGGFGDVSRLYGIGGSCSVRQWAKKNGSFAQNGTDQPKEVAAERKKKRQFRDQRRIAELEAQFLEARQRVQLYALALEVAGRD